MKIPKVIHQTWKDNAVPPGLQRLADTWKENHPGWEYHLWTDIQNRKFIETFFPSFIDKYDAYPSHIQRVDAVRYLILYQYGGLFIDLDFECCKSMEPLLAQESCVFGKEPHEHCDVHNKDLIISNAIMASLPGHPFLLEVFQELNYSLEMNGDKNDQVLESTGPFMLTRVYSAFMNKQDITLLDHELVYPLTKDEIAALLETRIKTTEVMEKIKDAFAIHYYSGTWWNQQSHLNISKLEKPLSAPGQIPGDLILTVKQTITL